MVNLNSSITQLARWWRDDANKLAVAGMLTVVILLLAMTIYNGSRFGQGMAKVYETQSRYAR